jgi:protein-tyrosine phosphatase
MTTNLVQTPSAISSKKVPKILFVCLGNIIRSQIAHGIMHYLLDQENLNGQVFVDSAGTINDHQDQGPDPRVNQLLNSHQIEHFSQSRKITDQDYEYFDYIFVMDKMNYEYVVENKPNTLYTSVVVRFLRDFDKLKDSDEILDPYYGNMEDFEETYEIIYRSIQGLIKYLKKEYDLQAT